MITIILLIILNQICGRNLVVFMLKTLYSCHFLKLVAWRSWRSLLLLSVEYGIHTYRSITRENEIHIFILFFSAVYEEGVAPFSC